ncbi:hypothetical protein C7H84_26090 [Burkholderia sp. Nafp2/4-1b]|uniref:GNAT family N-acetyltransferase n=1 Tax=Burkholderia sp. Nafp2/4-1b TaxID=2116686 RepID=UPI000EF922D9|nr:GNAT family N-acetyltransferase [Burkholderia sp. Nafp2/4-1b]RKU00564.1 hypothetical protein C7H84_26090 [Burkholderia sp. Nafp2/4-1b]
MVAELISLRPTSAEDAELITVWLQAPGTASKLLWPFRVDIEGTKDFIRVSQNDPSVRLFVIEASKPIGLTLLYAIDLIKLDAFTGVLIGSPDDRRKGYGRESRRMLLSYGFEQLGLHQVFAKIRPENAAAEGLLLSMSYERIGPHEDNEEFIFFRLSREKWQERSPREHAHIETNSRLS